MVRTQGLRILALVLLLQQTCFAEGISAQEEGDCAASQASELGAGDDMVLLQSKQASSSWPHRRRSPCPVSKDVGYHSEWAMLYEPCAPDGVRKGGCSIVRGNTTTSTFDFYAVRGGEPSLSGNDMYRYAEQRVPGPVVDVTQGQTVIVKVLNRQYQTGVTVHWHGQDLNGENDMDGVPGVTQSPIEPFTEFEYKFTASPSGTFWYHSHMMGGQYADGLSGPLIVRPLPGHDPWAGLYDDEHIVYVQDWWHSPGNFDVSLLTSNYISPDASVSGGSYYASAFTPAMATAGGYMPLSDVEWTSVLVNGRGRYRKDPTSGQTTQFNVTRGKRYRFRVICGTASWLLNISVQSHKVDVIAVDGFDVKPTRTKYMLCSPGNRFDFLLNASSDVGNYRLDVSSLNGFNSPAILHYDGAPAPSLSQMTYGLDGLDNETWMNGGCTNAVGCGHADEVNLARNPNRLKPLVPTPPPTARSIRRINITLAGGQFMEMQQNDVNSIPGMPYTWYLQVDDSQPFTRYIMPKYPIAKWKHAGMSYEEAYQAWANNAGSSSPFVSNPTDQQDKYGNALQGDVTWGTNIVRLARGAVVDVVLNNPTKMAHPFHLHGQRFWLLGAGLDSAYFDPSKDEAMLNLADPVKQDTAIVPGYGWLVLRFKADNPGAWSFHCHVDVHMSAGMFVTLLVE